MNTHIALILLPNFNMHATTAFIDPFRAANYLHSKAIYSWKFVGLEHGSVTASNGMGIHCSTSIQDLNEKVDMLVVCASWNPETHNIKVLNQKLQHYYRSGVLVVGLDTGAQILAYAGLTQNRKVTVHYEHIASMRELFPHTDICDELFVIDQRIVSCCGGQASTDLALSLINQHHGIDFTNSAARYIFHDRWRSSSDSQLPVDYEPVGYMAPSKLREAIILMENNLEQTLTITEIAQHLNISQRQLERLYKQHTGTSPIQYYLEVRLDRAHGMVTQTQLPMLTIAVACGFNSQERFSKAYRQRFKSTPSMDRKQGGTPFHFRSFPAPHHA